jgi:hypothetical protein
VHKNMVSAVSLDATILKAGDYFNRSQLCTILGAALERLASEQPEDAVAALQRLLVTSNASYQSRDQFSVLEEEEVTDFENLAGSSLDLDPLALVTLERLPRAGAGRGDDLSQRRCWAGGFSRPLLDGWVPQPSPCCAAASVAGAFNALYDFGREHTKSATIVEVAELMAKNCDRLYAQRQQRVERLLGIEEGAVSGVISVLDAELLARGLDWTSSGTEKVTRAVAFSTLRDVLASIPSDAFADTSDGVVEALRRVLGIETSSNVAESDAADDELHAQIVVSCGPDWEQELGELFAKRRGSMRLRVAQPHTGEIGSWGVKQASVDLSAERGLDPLHVQVLLGRKGGQKVETPLSKDDSPEAIEHQWACLKSAFSKPRSALLFHLTNHYALIYAWREWTEETACEQGPLRARRQILTARKGQRPSVWLDFEEARSIMISWSGYHVLQLQRAACTLPESTGVEAASPGGA